MNKDNIGDLVLAETMKIVGNVSDYLAVQYKNVRPFDKTPISNQEQLFNYDIQYGPDNPKAVENMQALVQKEGKDKVNEYLFRIDQIRSKTKGGQ